MRFARVAAAVAGGAALVSLGCSRSAPAVEPPVPEPRLEAGASVACTPTSGRDLALRPVVRGLVRPVLVSAPAGDPRLWVVEQDGRIRVFDPGSGGVETFLDISSAVATRNPEQGLLGLAFHPRYAETGRFFVNYSDVRKGATVVAEYRVDASDPNRAVPTEKRLLRVDQPYGNHNGGHLAFGPKDGFLYVGLGDGGSGGDPQGNGQNLDTLLGAMLRLDVDSTDEGYTSPATNPFVGTEGARAEIWAWGLRNPWRYAFDPSNGDLYIGDVGQNAVEEIDWQPGSSAGGENYGWSVHEGTACFGGDPRCGDAGLTPPVVDLDARPPCNSITGGEVYRGRCLPDLAGTYFWSDYCHDYVRSVEMSEGRATRHEDWTGLDPDGDLLSGVSSFGVDGSGELYVVSHRNGIVYRLVAAPTPGG